MTAVLGSEETSPWTMNTPLPKLRYEKKFIAEGFSLGEVLTWVHRNPAAFREAYPNRVINNIYLDSPGLTDYHDHIQGAAHRSKTRVRWYGTSAEGLERPVLERKIKRGHAGTKFSYPLPCLTQNGAPLRHHLQEAFQAPSLPENLRSLLKLVAPSLFNRYRRHYFVSGDRKLRLTVDYGIQFGKPHAMNGKLSRSILLPTVVVELKFEPEHTDKAAVAANALPLRLTRCSKYVLGIEHVDKH